MLTFIGRILSIMVTHKIHLPLFQQTDYRSSLLLCITYEVVLEFLQASTSTTPSVNPNPSVNPPCPPARLATNSASKVTKMNLQPLRMSSNLDSTVADVEKEGVDAFLNNLVSFAYTRVITLGAHNCSCGQRCHNESSRGRLYRFHESRCSRRYRRAMVQHYRMLASSVNPLPQRIRIKLARSPVERFQILRLQTCIQALLRLLHPLIFNPPLP